MLRPTIIAFCLAILSRVFSHTQLFKIGTIHCGIWKRPFFRSQLLEGAIISESCLLTCVSSWPSLTYLGVFLVEICVLFVSDMILRTTTYHIFRITIVTHTKSPLERRAPPTTFGDADMAYPLHWSHSCSWTCRSSSGSSRRRSSRSSRRATAATSTATPAAMKILHRLQNSSFTWMRNSLAVAVVFASFDANKKTNQYRMRQFSKSEAAIDDPYLPPTYFCH